MLNLKQLWTGYNKGARSHASLLPWFQPVTDGLIINHDGSLMAIFEYDGIDYDSTNADDADAATMRMGAAFGAFDQRNTITLALHKRRCVYIEDSDIPHTVPREVERQWLNHVDNGNLARLRHTITVTYQAFTGSGSLFESITALTQGAGFTITGAVGRALKDHMLMRGGIQRVEGKIEGAISAFEAQLESFAVGLRMLNMRRLTNNRLLTELSNSINIASQRTAVSVPPLGPVYLNTLLPTDTLERVDGGLLRFTGADGRKLVSMLSLKGYPSTLSNTTAEQLLMLPGDFSVFQTFRFLDREKAHALIMDIEAKCRAAIKTPLQQMMEKATGQETEKVDTGQLVLAEDAQAALVEMTAENVNFGYHSLGVQIIGNDLQDLIATKKAVMEVLKNASFGVVDEVLHQVGAFAATIPGAGNASVRSTLISTRNLADLALVRSIQPGPSENRYLTQQRGVPSRSLALFPTPSGVPEHFNLHVGDVGHFMIVGQSGGGKTSLMNYLFSCWMRYSPCRIIVLDKDNSCYLTLKALGGSYVRLANAEGHVSTMNPLRWIDSPNRWPEIARWIMGAMSAFGSAPLTEKQAQSIYNAISMLASAGVDGRRTLGTIKSILDGIDGELSARLSPWVRPTNANSGANYGAMFDNEHDAFAQQLQAGASGVIGIDMGGLLKDERLAPSVLEYLFMSIDDIVDGKIPTLIYLEEGWYLLGNQRFREGFEDWLKTMRKRMAAVGVTTQSVQDIARSGISSALNDNIRTRIFLPNPQALASRDTYKDFLGLSDEDVQLIRALTPKRHYMVWQDGRKRILEADLPPRVLAMTLSDQRARSIFDKHFVEGDESSVFRYIDEVCNA